MQRYRFFASRSQIADSRIKLDADEAHHLVRVLRLSQGDRVFVFDGEGSEWECEIVQADKREVELNILHQLIEPVESPLQLTLAQAMLKGDKFDLIVQKCTELGVTSIVPLITDHCEIRRVDAQANRMVQRWRRISLEAIKQCGRRRLVEISKPVIFASFCQSMAGKNSLIFSERGGRNLHEVASSLGAISNISLLIGPEGGWNNDELQLAENYGLVTVYLGSRILRAETAAIAAVTILQHLFGDIK